MPCFVIQISRLAGRSQPTPGQVAQLGATLLNSRGIGREAVAEALDTGLFTGQSARHLGWSHRTFEEYLAARSLGNSGRTDRELADLLVGHGSHVQSVVPQLRGLAGWLAAHREGVFDEIAKIDPTSLLLMPTRGEGANQAVLLREVLQAVDEGRAWVEYWTVARRFESIRSPAVTAVLRDFLGRSAIGDNALTLAVAIAGAVRDAALAPDLLRIALSDQFDAGLRANAVQALDQVGDSSSVSVLRQLVDNPRPDDVMDELRGAVLRTLWPGGLTASEVLAAVSPSRAESFMGNYWLFLRQDFLGGLKTTSDIIESLRWLRTQNASHTYPYSWQQFLGASSSSRGDLCVGCRSPR